MKPLFQASSKYKIDVCSIRGQQEYSCKCSQLLSENHKRENAKSDAEHPNHISIKMTGFTTNSFMMVVIPRMERMLNMLETRRLPNARLVSPFLAAITEVMSSGRLVPIESTVRPMILSGNTQIRSQ